MQEQLAVLPSPDNIALVSDGAMTIKEAVRFSMIGRTVLYNLMESGKLPYVRIGRKRLIPRKRLLELMAEHVVKR